MELSYIIYGALSCSSHNRTHVENNDMCSNFVVFSRFFIIIIWCVGFLFLLLFNHHTCIMTKWLYAFKTFHRSVRSFVLPSLANNILYYDIRICLECVQCFARCHYIPSPIATNSDCHKCLFLHQFRPKKKYAWYITMKYDTTMLLLLLLLFCSSFFSPMYLNVILMTLLLRNKLLYEFQWVLNIHRAAFKTECKIVVYIAILLPSLKASENIIYDFLNQLALWKIVCEIASNLGVAYCRRRRRRVWQTHHQQCQRAIESIS